jgi:hypothetical protein
MELSLSLLCLLAEKLSTQNRKLELCAQWFLKVLQLPMPHGPGASGRELSKTRTTCIWQLRRGAKDFRERGPLPEIIRHLACCSAHIAVIAARSWERLLRVLPLVKGFHLENAIKLTQGRKGAKTQGFRLPRAVAGRVSQLGLPFLRHRPVPCAFASLRLCVNSSFFLGQRLFGDIGSDQADVCQNGTL